MIGKPMPDKSIYLNVSQQVELTPSLLAQQLYKEFGHKDRVGFLQSFLSELENKFEDYHMAIEMAEFYLDLITQGIQLNRLQVNQLPNESILKEALDYLFREEQEGEAS